jgi:hypothetical protein
MHEQEWGKGMGMHGGWGHHEKMAMEMMLWKYLSEEQQKDLLIRSLDIKIKMKSLKISMMKEKLRLMEEKLDIYRAAKDMLQRGR